MPKLSIPCARCGHGVEVDEQTINNAAALGATLNVEHAEGECPGSAAPPTVDAALPRRFRVQLLALELPNDPDFDESELGFPDPTYNGVPVEILAGTGSTFLAENFATAVNGPMTVWLDKAWHTMQENAAFADLPNPTPTPSA